MGATGSGGAKSNRTGQSTGLANMKRPGRPTAKTEAKTKAQKPDPMFSDDINEDMFDDTAFVLKWRIAISGDGLVKAEEDDGGLANNAKGGR